MVLAVKHIVVLSITLLFLFFGIIGTVCMDGACGGNNDGWEFVSYFGWGLGLTSTCVGILTSQGGSSSTDLNKLEAEREAALTSKSQS